MKMSRMMAGLLAGAGLAVVAAGPAAADMAETYQQYQSGLIAKQICSDSKLSQDEFNKLNEALDKKVNYELGAGERLSLIESAKVSTRKLVNREGCDSPDVTALITLFDELSR
ncbi:MAG TPA: hypothetical protein VED46_14190 [Alphaproteobacteria bacterium]|nr:hypothetical protein [Alphaproteobacteria bacterium]